MKHFFFCLLLFGSLLSFSQSNKYWIRLKDKNHNSFSLSHPLDFLSQKSVERRLNQHIPIVETDLPVSQSYVDSLSPFINYLQHRIKWFNLIVVDMNNAITFRTDTTFAQRDTVYTTDTFSVTIYDSIFIYKTVNISGSSYSFATSVAYHPKIVHDTINPHPGPVYIRDTVFVTDVVTGNNFDSLKRFSFIDTIAEIKNNPLRSSFVNKKLEEVPPVNQLILYPNKYGAAYHQINMLNADLLHQMGYNGKGITISMMDNGFYNANNIAAFDSVRPQILGTWDFVNNEANVYDDGSHGENTFSCIAANLPNKFIGTAPGAYFYLFVTEDDSKEWIMEEYNWAAAAEVADSAGAQIFSTSLGYTEYDGGEGSHTYADLNGHNTLITCAANMAFGKGILVLNSAGNEGAKPWKYIAAPADGDSVLAIGAVDSTGKVTSFSSRGPNAAGLVKPDLCAQGQNSAVISTGGGVGYSNGTSFSCPIMAGCFASLWSAFPNKTAHEIKDAVMISADHFWTPDSLHGYGIPNFYNAYLFLKNNYNQGIFPVTNEPVVYPNPFTTDLNVSFYNEEPGNHKIELFDLQGRKVYSNYIHIRNTTFEFVKIDGDVLQPGEYILRIDETRELTQHLLKLN